MRLGKIIRRFEEPAESPMNIPIPIPIPISISISIQFQSQQHQNQRSLNQKNQLLFDPSSYDIPVLIDVATGQAYGREDILPGGRRASEIYQMLESGRTEAAILEDGKEGLEGKAITMLGGIP
jgi:predicted glycosyl hydrolase (DUF1957 family)